MGGEVLGYQGDHGPQDHGSWPSGRRFLVLSLPRLAFGTVSAAFTDGYEGIDHETFHQLERVQVAGRRYAG
jgi:hypothetical protein